MPAVRSAPVLQIVEVLGPAEQGKSRPFKCIAEDGHMYYVKGQQTNRASLWREWICAHVAQAFGLALAPDFSVQEFLADHVFAAQWDRLHGDLVTQAQYARRLHDALPAASVALEAAPEEWLWENSEFDLPANFDRAKALGVLSRCATPELWRTV